MLVGSRIAAMRHAHGVIRFLTLFAFPAFVHSFVPSLYVCVCRPGRHFICYQMRQFEIHSTKCAKQTSNESTQNDETTED